MKKIKLIRIAVIVFLLVIVSNSISAQMQSDKKYRFIINIPTNWSKQSHMDGKDKIFDYSSPDQNAGVQLRVFEATPQVTVDILCQAYESSYLPAGIRKESLVDYTSVNGIPGKQGLYILNYNNTEVTIATFYTVQNNIGYVLSAIIPTGMVEEKGTELKQITQSFIIDGFEKDVVIKKETEKPKGLSGLLGGTSNNNNNQQSNSGFGGSTSSGISSGGISGSSNSINRDHIVGRYNFTHRSDGKNLLNYWYLDFNKDGTYVDEHELKEGNYRTGHKGTWSVDGDQLITKHISGNISGTYKIKGKELLSQGGNVTMYFKKK